MNRLARLFVALLRAMLGLFALVLVLAALYVSLGRQLLPLVAEYRAEVEARARDALGMPLTIGSLEGGWSGLAPLLTVHDLMLGEGSSAVRLDQVRLVPDILGSLLARQPRLANLQVEGLQLSLVQDAEGHWTVEGLPSREPQQALDVQRLLRRLPMLEELSLLDSQLTFEPFEQKPLSLTYASFTLRSSAKRLRLDGHLLLPDGQPLSLRLNSRIDQQDWRASNAELYLSLPQSNWAAWLPAGLTRDWRIERAEIGGEFWLDWQRGRVQRAVARLHAPELRGGYAARKAVRIDDLGLNAYYEQQEDGAELLVDSLALSLGETRWGELHLALRHELAKDDREERWQLSGDRLDLTPLTPVVLALAPLPDKAAEVLGALKPQGTLRNLQLSYLPQRSDAKRVQFSTNLERVGIGSWHGVPAVENASGSVTGDLGGGEALTVSTDFGLHLDTLFPKIWRYRQAAARLLWTLDDQAFTLRSPYLQVVGEEGRIAGDFLIRLMKDPALEDYMDLRVGLRDGDAQYTTKYLPTLSPGLSPKLAEWLQTAIRGGKVDEGWFEYQGSLQKGADAAARSLSLFFRVHDAELAFQPGWPVLREARGEVLIEDTGVQVRVPEGRLLDSKVEAVSVDIPHVDSGQTSHLLLDGQLQSSLGDALKILQEAPIGTAAIFSGWQGEGPLAGQLKLDIPLAHGQAPKVVVDFATEGARLQLAAPKLELSQLKGAFRYDTANGLSAPDIRAQVFGRAVQGKAIAGGPRGNVQTRIEANGRVPVKTLSDWLGVTRPLPLSGELPYKLNLLLAGADSQLNVSSDLKGTLIDLPAPYGKAAADSSNATWRMTLQGNERRYWLDYAGQASLAFAAPVGQLQQGRGLLRLGGARAILPSGQGLRVSGRVAELDWSAWQDTAKRYAASQNNREALQFFRGANLQIERFKGFGSELEQLSVQLERGQQGWSLDLDSAPAKGNVLLPDASGAPIQVKLARLSFPPAEPPKEGESAVDKPDPLAAFDPKQIPALDLHIDKVLQGDQLLGSWSLKARPTAQGVQVSDLAMGLKGMQLQGSAAWEGAPGSTRSSFKGRLAGDNLADVLLAWGFAPTATSESFRLNVDGNWPGSPLWFSLKRYSGNLEPRLRKGQFVEVQGSASALRVFGLLNFNSIGRRLRLDFSDLLGRGLSYDTTKALLVGQNGVFETREPLRVVGPSSTLELNGQLDMARDQIDAKLLVTLPVSNNLPLAALIVGAPAVGGALFVVDKLLGDKVARFASVQYSVKGDWKDPQISFEKPFEKPR
ncbi:TIGR02099 family protein [Pseudomonas alcaligenes]|uniref:TIGR02099 family protein n=1 Tax=Aquipseudomonas alcaligenes TaxID=43263 RepID=A0ABR7S3X2_AQUAC|nr:YhdP family protein [Pseudomonas alcaligenes]MBC9252158.1 TIGR02099 family protein [Pseudomonas alcaligenes]